MATKKPTKRKAPGKSTRAKKKKAPAKPRKATEQKAPRKRRATKKAAGTKSKRKSAKAGSTKRPTKRKRASSKAASSKSTPRKRAAKKANGAKKRPLKRTTKRRVLGTSPAVEPKAPRPIEPTVDATPRPAAHTSSAPPSIKDAVAAYMNKLPNSHGALGSQFRKIVSTAAVGVDGAIKWAHDDWKDPHGVLHGASEKAATVRELLKQAVTRRREHGRRRR